MFNEEAIKKDIEKLEFLLKKEKDEIKKSKILSAIEYSKEVLDDIKYGDTLLDSKRKIEIYSLMGQIRKLYNPYNKYIDSFTEELDSNYEELNYCECQNMKSLTKEDYLTLIGDFFKDLDEELFNNFNEIYKNKNDQIIFLGRNNEFGLGVTYTIPYLNKQYVATYYDVEKMSPIEIITGFHEFGHGIASHMNYERYIKEDTLKELETAFIEMISMDYCSKYFNNTDFYLQGLINLDVKYDDLFDYYELDEFSKEYDILSTNEEEIKKVLKRNSLEEFREYYLNYNIYNKYLTAYTIALNLYVIYLEDKEKALWILKRIINNNSIKESDMILKNIPIESKVIKYKKYLESKVNKKM